MSNLKFTLIMTVSFIVASLTLGYSIATIEINQYIAQHDRECIGFDVKEVE